MVSSSKLFSVSTVIQDRGSLFFYFVLLIISTICLSSTYDVDEVIAKESNLSNSFHNDKFAPERTTRWDCQEEGNDLEVNDSETWASMYIGFNNNIIVKTGSHLIIEDDCVVHMGPEKRIYVERGAKLTIRGTITNLCPKERWWGIQVQGNSNLAQPSPLSGIPQPEEAGIVYVDGGTITMAKTAISTKDSRVPWPEYQEYWGGVVYAINGTFTNNRRAVEFMNYGFNNFSRFIGCNFVGTGYDEYGVSIWACNNIIFEQNIFSDLSEAAIYASSAQYYVYDNNEFRNVNIAIFSDEIFTASTLQIGKDINTYGGEPNVFTGNKLDVYWNSITFNNISRIYDNYMNSDESIQIEGPTRYLIKNNIIESQNRGVFVKNTSLDASRIMTNTIYSDIGVEVFGDNDRTDLICNEFDCIDTAIIVSGNQNQTGKIRFSQGYLTGAAGNCFAGGIDIATTGVTQSFRYNYYDGNDCEEPVNVGNYDKYDEDVPTDCDAIFNSNLKKPINNLSLFQNTKGELHKDSDIRGFISSRNYHIYEKWYNGGTEVVTVSDSVYLRNMAKFSNSNGYHSRALLRRIFNDPVDIYISFKSKKAYIDNENIVLESSFTVFPNPARSYLNLQDRSNSADYVKILDVSGRCVYESKFQYSNIISVDGLSGGFYIVQFYGNDKLQAIKKIVVNPDE